jgi:hypothetical protein
MIITNSVSPDTTAEISEGEIVVLIPNAHCGEVGEPITHEVLQIINGLANAGYWPLDWGEGDDRHTTLYFVKGDSPTQTQQQAQYFIKREGEV